MKGSLKLQGVFVQSVNSIGLALNEKKLRKIIAFKVNIQQRKVNKQLDFYYLKNICSLSG